MKHIATTFAASVIGLFLIAPVSAGEDHMILAMEHAGMAEAHGADDYVKVLLKHAEESLKHAQAAEKQRANEHMHITESVQHLKQAIEHAKANHVDVATKHVEEALAHMRKSSVR